MHGERVSYQATAHLFQFTLIDMQNAAAADFCMFRFMSLAVQKKQPTTTQKLKWRKKN